MLFTLFLPGERLRDLLQRYWLEDPTENPQIPAECESGPAPAVRNYGDVLEGAYELQIANLNLSNISLFDLIQPVDFHICSGYYPACWLLT